jgi:hypothetical protein
MRTREPGSASSASEDLERAVMLSTEIGSGLFNAVVGFEHFRSGGQAVSWGMTGNINDAADLFRLDA